MQGRTPFVPHFAVLLVALAATACENVCDEVAEEAEASGCAEGLPEDDGEVSEEEAACEGDREKRAQCLLDFTDNVCFITEEEAQAVAGCMEGGS